jgi:predicted Mrr-cat superfamily restriction endonuclease
LKRHPKWEGDLDNISDMCDSDDEDEAKEYEIPDIDQIERIRLLSNAFAWLEKEKLSANSFKLHDNFVF